MLLLAPAGAGAATQVGQTFTPTTGCGGNVTLLQTTTVPPGGYTVPSAGVLTSWRFQGGLAGATVFKFKVARPAGGSNFTIIGSSELQAMVPGALSSFPIRIPVAAGDVIGLFDPTNQLCATGAAGFQISFVIGDAAVGSTSAYGTVGGRLDLSALLEPDADNDGFGDETQDCNPSSASATTDCSPPDTQITKGPRDRAKRKVATFEFSGSDARAVAKFECSLDGDAFAVCNSPLAVAVKKGKHTFSVRALDDSGNVDASPATDDWKVKKKKRKKK